MKAFAPNGRLIVATADTVTCNAVLSGATRLPDGTLDVDYIGESEVCWDDQRVTTDTRGVDLFVDEDGNEWPEDAIHLEGEEPRAIPAPVQGLQVVVATFTHKHGTDSRVFASASGAEAWRQAIARDGWDGFMNEDAPADPAAKADRYFERGNELGDEFFETTTAELEGFSGRGAPSAAPDAPAPAFDWRKIAKDLAVDLSNCTHQIGQMKCMFDDEDGSIQRAIDGAEETMDRYNAGLKGPSNVAIASVWSCTTDGDNCPLTTTVHATRTEAEQRARDELAEDCPAHQRAHLDSLTGDALSEAWSDKFDGACIIEEHTRS